MKTNSNRKYWMNTFFDWKGALKEYENNYHNTGRKRTRNF